MEWYEDGAFNNPLGTDEYTAAKKYVVVSTSIKNVQSVIEVKHKIINIMNVSIVISFCFLIMSRVLLAQNTNLSNVKFDHVANNFLEEGIT